MPFGEFEDFDDCVKQNQDKDDPEAYCATIKREIEDKMEKIQIINKSDGRFVIYGPANVEIKDGEGEIIKSDALKDSLPQLLKRARFSVQHSDILVGEILPKFKKGGVTYKTDVHKPEEFELKMFPFLDKDVKALFTVGEVWDDNSSSVKTRKAIEGGELGSFSISGINLISDVECNDGMCANVISKLDLSSITICEKGMNQHSQFQVINKIDDVFKSLCPMGKSAPCENCTWGGIFKYDFDIDKLSDTTKNDIKSCKSHRSCKASHGEEAQKIKEGNEMPDDDKDKDKKETDDALDKGANFVKKEDFDKLSKSVEEILKAIKKAEDDMDEDDKDKVVPPEKTEEKQNDDDKDDDDDDKDTITLQDVKKLLKKDRKKIAGDVAKAIMKEAKLGRSTKRPGSVLDKLINKDKNEGVDLENVKKLVSEGRAAELLR